MNLSPFWKIFLILLVLNFLVFPFLELFVFNTFYHSEFSSLAFIIIWAISGFLFLIFLFVALIKGFLFLISGRKKRVFSKKEKIEEIQKEIEKWKKEGILTEKQAEILLSRYKKESPPKPTKPKEPFDWHKLIKIFAIFGVVSIGVGVVLIIAANWGQTPPWVSSSLLILGTILVYFWGYLLKYQRKTHPILGKCLIYLGSFLFFADLVLIAQLYHIRVEFSHFLFLWAVGILPLAYFLRMKPLLGLSSLAFFFWTLFQTFSFIFYERNLFFSGIFFPEIPEKLFLPLSHYLGLLIIGGVFFPLAYRLRSLGILAQNLFEFLFLLWLSLFFQIFAQAKLPLFDSLFFYFIIGWGILALGEFHLKLKNYREFRKVYFLFGIFLIFLTTLLLGTPSIYNPSSRTIPPFSMIFSFLFLVECFLAILWGAQKREEFLISVGIFSFLIFATARFFDWILFLGRNPHLNGGLLFLSIGALIWGTSEALSKYKKTQKLPVVENSISLGVLVVLSSTLFLSSPAIYPEFKEKEMSFVSLIFNFLLLGEIAGILYLGAQRRNEGFLYLGLNSLLIFALVRSFDWIAHFTEEAFLNSSLFFLLMGGIIFGIGKILLNYEKTKDLKVSFWAGNLGSWVIFVSTFILTFRQIYHQKEILLPFFFNLLLFGESCLWVWMGVQERRKEYVNLGILFFSLLIIARYFSVGWSYIQRGTAFIIGGVILIVLSYFLNKYRKKLLKRFEKK